MNFSRNLLTAAVASSVVMLAACGGGSNKGSSTASTSATSSYEVSGVVSKGVVSNGIVTAYELNADGSVKGAVGTATTNASGEYQIQLDPAYAGGVVKLEITAGATTKMKCDVAAGCGSTAFGQEMALANTFKLNALVKPEGAKVTLPVTPLTHMAAARAIASKNISKAGVDAANSEVSNLVGFDIVTTEVSDITTTTNIDAKGKAAAAYALYNAGVGSAIMAEGLEAGLEKLAQAFEDGEFTAADALTITKIMEAIDSNTFKVSEALSSTILKEAVANVRAQVAQTQSQIVDGGFKPPATTSITDAASGITAAKALLTNARTVITQAVALEEKGESSVASFEAQAQVAADALDADTIVASQVLGEVVDQVLTSLDAQTTLSKELANPQTYSVEIKNKSGTTIGTVTVAFATAGGISMTINGTLSGAKTVTIENLKLATNLTAANLTVNAGVIEAITASSVTLKLTGKLISDQSSLTFTDMSAALTMAQTVTVDLKPDANNDSLEGQIQSLLLNGDLALANATASFTGKGLIELVKLSPVTEAPVSLKRLEVGGEFVSGTSKLSASAKLRIDNAASFDTFNFLDYAFNEHAWVNGTLTTEALNMTAINGEITKVEAANAGKTVSSWSAMAWQNSFGMSNYMLDTYLNDGSFGSATSTNAFSSTGLDAAIAAQLPGSKVKQVWNSYAWYNSASGGSFNASVELDSPETLDSFIKGQLIVTAQVQLPELPKLLASISVDRSSLNGGSATVLVTIDGKTFKIVASSADVSAENATATLVISDATGTVKYEMTFTGDTMTGKVYAGSLAVGDIVRLSNGAVKVTYSDGSIETLQ